MTTQRKIAPTPTNKAGSANAAAPVGETAPPVTGGIVVLGRPTPLGPMEMVFPPTTVVSVEAPWPILYVVPFKIASVLSTEKVNPPIVTTEKFGSGATVVVPRPTPLLPSEIVWLPTTILVGFDPGPIVYVVPEMTAKLGPTVNVRPCAVITSGAIGAPVILIGATVVDGKITPPLPMVRVLVPIFMVLLDPAPIPIAKVVPEMMA